jgi:simple sugar transport system substrate-binding protein
MESRRPRLVTFARRLLPLLVVVLTAFVVAGCGDDDDDSGNGGGGGGGGEAQQSENAVANFAIVTPEKGSDYGWNQQSIDAARKIASERGVELEVADNAGYEDVTPILRELATGGTNFIIAQASGYNTAAPDVSVQTEIPSLIWDNPEAAQPGLVANAEAQGQGGGYLAGVLAAQTSKSGTVGIVISADDTNWNRMAGGFVKGAQSVKPDIEIKLAQIGQAGYADTAGGKRVTEQVIADGADVIFGMGDGSSFGMIQAVEAADDVKFIDVIGDKTKIDKQGILLSSVLWNFDVLFNQAIDDVEAGTFGETNYALDLENEGISLLQTDQIDDAAWQDVEKAREAIVNGEVEVPETTKKSQVEDLIRGG